MAKQKKIAYGIAEDGTSLKLAYLVRDGHQVSLQALEQVELDQSLYHHSGDANPEVGEGDAGGELRLDDLSVDSLSSFKSKAYENLFQTFSLSQGVIALNTFEEQIIKMPINSPDIGNGLRNKLVRDNLPPGEYKDGHWQSSIVSINDQAELWIHHGYNRLLDIVDNAQKVQKNKFFFQLADANDLALASLFATSTPADSTERNMVLYLGKDYRRALVFDGNKWTFSLPIFLTQQQPDIDIVYSKLSLALDEAHISDPDNVYVCGDNCFLDSIEYLRTKLPNSHVEMWHLNNLYLDRDVTQMYDADLIARFMLPIALAWKALTQDNPYTIKSNFLPAFVVEGQKVFKIAWHGYVLFAFLFVSALYVTFAVKQLNFSIAHESSLNTVLTKEYTYKKQQAEEMLAKQRAVEQQKENINVMKTLLDKKNPWTEIITRLNNSFQTHPTSWLTNLRKDGEGFKISGVTTNRANIVYFSGLFPSGSIINAKHRKIRSFTVWDFEINYAYPEVDWYKMMEADAEALRKYQEERKATALGVQITDISQTGKPAETPVQKTGDLTKTKKQDQNVTVTSSIIDIPMPPKNMVSDGTDPIVKSYRDVVTAFNAKNDWLMIDLGVKFINNYTTSPLVAYVRWYLAYRAWQSRQYQKALLWLEPQQKIHDAVYPYTLLLSSMVYKDTGDRKSAENNWHTIVSDYPQHPTAKTAKKFLNAK